VQPAATSSGDIAEIETETAEAAEAAPAPSPEPRAGLRAIWRQLRHGIPAERYTREYFLSERCDGFSEFMRARDLSYVKKRLLEKVDPRPGERVLEIGCGRGEVLNACAERGARGVGLDYARDAVRLTRETCGGGASVVRADATVLPLASAHFDKVLLGDVLEHLTPEQARRMLEEVHRVLRPGGTLVLHTSPNVFFMHLLLPWLIAALWLAGRRPVARLLFGQYQASWQYHVREYSIGRLERLFRASPFRRYDVSCDRDVLRGGQSHYTASLTSSVWVRGLARISATGPLLRLLGNDLWAVARKAAA
jgi:ubiquinone/menaquinone biosynthesis C-methylase UbiE